MKDIRETAAMAKLTLNAEEKRRAETEIPATLRLSTYLAEVEDITPPAEIAFTMDDLREDIPTDPDVSRKHIALSPHFAKETVRVARTVGGQHD